MVVISAKNGFYLFVFTFNLAARCPSPDITDKKAMKRHFAALEED